MSIYASIFGFDAGDHDEGCKKLVKRRRDPKKMLNCMIFASGKKMRRSRWNGSA